MGKVYRFIRSVLRDRRGMTTVEYVIALCLVGALGVGMWRSFGNTVKDRLSDAKGSISEKSTEAIEAGKVVPE